MLLIKFWVQVGPHLQPWRSLRLGLQQHLKPQRFQQHPIRNAHKVFFKWQIPHNLWNYDPNIFSLHISFVFKIFHAIFYFPPTEQTLEGRSWTLKLIRIQNLVQIWKALCTSFLEVRLNIFSTSYFRRYEDWCFYAKLQSGWFREEIKWNKRIFAC